MFNPKLNFSVGTVGMFAGLWYIFTVISYGTAVPAGLFLPGILIGCAIGRVYGHIEGLVVGK